MNLSWSRLIRRVLLQSRPTGGRRCRRLCSTISESLETRSLLSAQAFTTQLEFESAVSDLSNRHIVNFDEIDASPLNQTYLGRSEFEGTEYLSEGISFVAPYPMFIAPAGLTWNPTSSLSIGRFPFDPADPIFEDNDDLVIAFDTPVDAVSFRYVNSGSFTGESIKFLNANGGLIEQISPTTEFVGLLSIGQPVAKIIIDEGRLDHDDVNYDSFVFYPTKYTCGDISSTTIFVDDFNRPDGDIGNGWAISSDSDVAMTIASNQLMNSSDSGNDLLSGIYRSLPFSNSARIEATLSEMSASTGASRFYSQFLVRSDGSISSGYGILVLRSSDGFNNSQVVLVEDGEWISSSISPFQFSQSLLIDVVIQSDGSIDGTISEGSQSFEFSFGPRTITASGGNFQFVTPGNDPRNSTLNIRPRLDDLKLTPFRTIINDNFNTQKSSDRLTFKGTARYAGNSSNGYITLVTASPDQMGTVILDSHNERALDFDFETHYSIKNGNEADGIGIGYGNLSGAAFGERGQASTRNGLWIVLDTYRDFAGNAELEVWYNTEILYNLSLPSSALRGSFRDLELSMRHTGTTGILTLRHSSSLIGTRTITIPDWNPQSNWRWGIGARTGTRYDWHVIEDLNIKDVTGSLRPDVQVAVSGGGFLRYDSEGASWNWSTSDINGDLQQVDLILRNEHDDVVRTESQTSGFRRDGGTTSGTFNWQPSDGLGEFTLEMVAYDRYGCAHAVAAPVTMLDDDIQGPEVYLTYGADQLPLVEPVTQSHGVVNSFGWQIDDFSTKNSGFSSALVEIRRDGQLISSFTSTETPKQSVFLDLYGTGVFDISVTAFDSDSDRGAVDRSATTVHGQIIVTNSAPKVEIGLNKQVLEGEPVTFSVLGVTDADGAGDVLQYLWDFGNGNVQNGATTSCIFPEQGTYSVNLTVIDAFGLTAEDTQTVFVSNANPKITSVSVTENVQPGQIVNFSVLATDVDADTLTYQYDFTSNGSVDKVGSNNAQTIFENAGIYTATIGVTDEDGGKAVTQVIVPVGIDTNLITEIQFATTETLLTEGDSATTVVARLSSPSPVPIEIPVFVSGTASAKDYQLSTSILRFPAGSTEAGLQIDVIDDSVDERDTETLILSATVGNATTTTHTVFINDNDAVPKVHFLNPGETISEDNGPALIIAISNQISEKDVTIPLTFSGTAIRGSDWDEGSTPAEIVIPAGQQVGSYVLNILPDDLPEGNETVLVEMGEPVNALLDETPGSSTIMTLTIPYNDFPRVQWTTINKSVSESAGSIGLTATLSTASTLPVSVDWSLIGGTATVGEDFSLPTSGTLTFAPGETEQTLTIQIINDANTENGENLVLELSSPANAILGEPVRTIASIVDNDRKVSLTTTSQTVWEDAGYVVVTAQISEPSPDAVQIPISVRSATAIEGEDFAVDQNVIVIVPNQLTGSVLIPIMNDLENEPYREQFIVSLGVPANASINARSRQEIIIEDDDPVALPTEHYYRFSEDAGSVTLGVKLSAPTNKVVRIPFSFKGSLSLGGDFTFPSGSEIVIPPGDIEAGFEVNILDDNFGEGDESVIFKLECAVNAVVPVGGYYIVTQWGWLGSQWYPFQSVQYLDDIKLSIDDNDGDTFVRFTTSELRTTERESDFFKSFGVTLNREAPEDIFVPIELAEASLLTINSAKESKDYAKPAGIVIPKGQKSATGSIRIIGNDSREATETVSFNIGVVRATFGDIKATVPSRLMLIIDDDDAPATTVSTSSKSTPTRSDQLQIDTRSSQSPPTMRIPSGNASLPANSGSLEIGNAADGYISGGSVFFDSNRNAVIDFLDLNGDGVQDADEPSEPSTTTYVDGTFAMEIPPGFDTNGDGVLNYDEGRYMIIGGVDASTGLPLEVALTGPAEAPAVSPLSTVLDHMLIASADTTATLTRLLDAFELTQIDFLFTNTIWDAYQGKAHPQQVHRVNAALHNTAVVISQSIAALNGAPPIAWIGDRTYAAIANALATTGATLDLQQRFVIDSLMRTVLDAAGLSADSQQIAGVASALAIVNAEIASLVADTGLEFLTLVAKAQAVAQGDLAGDFADVFGGNIALADVLPNYSEANVLATIAAKSARDMLPPAVAISDVRHIEGDFGETFAELTVRLFQPSVDPVSVRYRTIESTAEAGIDYTAVNDILEWAPGDTSDRTILIPIHGDTHFEGDERVLVELYESVNSVIRRDLGTVYLSEQDNLQYQVPAGLTAANLELSYEDSRILLIQNDEILFDVVADSARSVTITGAIDQPTVLVVTLGNDREALVGGLAFVGQTEGDRLQVNNALEQSFEHVVESATSGRLNFRDGFVEYSGVSQYSDDVSPTITIPSGTLLEGIEQTLTATTAVNADEFATTYSWRVFDAADQIVGEGTGGESFVWTAADDGSYRVELKTVSAYRGEYTTSIPLEIANAAPNFDPDSVNPVFQIIENSPNGTIVGTLSASLPAGTNDPLAFAVTGGTGSTVFAIDTATGAIFVIDSSQLDYETTTSFSLEVSVTDDDGGSATTIVTIELLNQASIFGNVFLDADFDSLFDGNEDGLYNVTVELLDVNGNIIESTTTSDGGFYLFEDYEPGLYRIREVQPTGVDDGPELPGSVDYTIVENDLIELSLQREDAADFLFSEFGQSVGSGDSASIGFWQNKHGQTLIASGGSKLANWLSESFANVFGTSLLDADGQTVADFYRSQLFLQKGKKVASPAKVDAQFMATALSVFFTNRNLAGEIGSQYGLNVTDNGLGAKIINIGSAGAAFGIEDDSNISIWGLLQATNRMTDEDDLLWGFCSIYDRNGDGVIDHEEQLLRILAHNVYAMING